MAAGAGFVEVDGSRGEGGGQALRSAAALSCATGTPVRVSRIRAGRAAPGMRAQHVAAVGVLAELCGARVSGAARGSGALEFVPGKGGGARAIRRDVGTAGSVPLVLQGALVAAALRAGRGGARLAVGGGTDVPWSPTADYAGAVLAGALGRFGVDCSLRAARRGYHPAGGGLVEAEVGPCAGGALSPVTLAGARGDGARRAELLCTFCGVGRGAVEGQCAGIAARLESEGWRVSSRIREEGAAGPGAAVLVHGSGPGWAAGADSLWDARRGAFGRDVAAAFLGGRGSVDDNLADMLVVPASLCAGTSAFRVGRMTRHLETALYVASEVTGCRYGAGRAPGGALEVRIEGVPPPPPPPPGAGAGAGARS